MSGSVSDPSAYPDRDEEAADLHDDLRARRIAHLIDDAAIEEYVNAPQDHLGHRWSLQEIKWYLSVKAFGGERLFPSVSWSPDGARYGVLTLRSEDGLQPAGDADYRELDEALADIFRRRVTQIRERPQAEDPRLRGVDLDGGGFS